MEAMQQDWISTVIKINSREIQRTIIITQKGDSK